MLLTDVFENFRKTCLEYYGLDPCHYFTSPGLSWDAMLKMTNVILEFMSDIDMYQFVEKGMRGGTSYIAHRHGEANNHYLSFYDPSKPTKYIMYLDANNLYGWAMSRHLPKGDFKWLTEDEWKKINLKQITDKGTIWEVDLEYPHELHDLNNDFPLAPEKMKITNEIISPYCQEIREMYKIPLGNTEKLITTLYDKTNYVCHYDNLRMYLSLGLKIKTVYRVLSFTQSKWLEPYRAFNTAKRAQAKNAFEKDFFKLLNNSVFGKTMENVRKRVSVKFTTYEKQATKLASKPTFRCSNIIDENLVVVSNKRETILLDKPAYVGMCTLDMSKYLMFKFHYTFIKKSPQFEI